jgi:site-specific DNA-methyltransferase (adenine-specific)
MIHHGDLFDVLPTLCANSVDACVTDPPYELSFMGKKWDGTGVAFRAETWTAVLRMLKPGAHLLAFGGTRAFHRLTCAIEDAGFEIRDCLSWLYGQGFPKSLNLPGGLGTALKPSWEPIILARKPMHGTVAANVLAHGTGALNIIASRIGSGGDYTVHMGGSSGSGRYGFNASAPRPSGGDYRETSGRWPANVLLDEDAAAALDEQTGELVSGAGCKSHPESQRFGGVAFGQPRATKGDGKDWNGDSGGASRFFYVAKPSREERDFGTAHLTARQRDHSRKAGNPGGDNPRNRGLQPRGNSHPTVKPVALMRYLVKLITPPGGLVLDPFTGSGTTGMACRYEHRPFIGIEREAEYVTIAEARIAAVAPLFAEDLA